MDASFFGVLPNMQPNAVDKNSVYWSNQARYKTMSLKFSESKKQGFKSTKQKLEKRQLDKLDRSEKEGTNWCQRYSDPEEDMYKTGRGPCKSKEECEERQQQNEYQRMLAEFEHNNMHNPRWHWYGDEPRYDKSHNSSNHYLAHDFPNSLDEDHPDYENNMDLSEFPDLALTLNEFSKSKGKLVVTTHVAVRDVGLPVALHRRNISPTARREAMLYPRYSFPWYEWRPPLYDYIYMMTAHHTPVTDEEQEINPSLKQAGDCRFDFVTATSNMQLHTLVSSL
jgi:hypothetical protein